MADPAKIDEYLEHFGVKGMHWGVKRGKGTPTAGSSDHSEASRIQAKVKAAGGVHTLSNDELKTLNDRLNLEATHKRLTDSTSQGEKLVKDFLVQQGKQQATQLAAKGVTEGGKWLAKHISKQIAK